MGPFHSGWWKQELSPALCDFQGMFCLLLSSSTFFVFISFLTQMSRFTFSQVSRGFLYRSLEISLCISLLSSTPPCKFCTSFFPLILYSVFSTQGYSCSILVSPPCALLWKFSLNSQLWYLQDTLHLFPFPWEISILHYFPIFERCFIHF